MDVMKEFYEFENQELRATQQESKVELYWDEPRVDAKTKLDILSFWRANRFAISSFLIWLATYYPFLCQH